ncbi:MAG: ribosomal RNA small subunit methyltransferase A [Acidobacteria bacterium]|nr:ribosomal RNA small subunit methyltransferase A [Acidobacteriota bacterium]
MTRRPPTPFSRRRFGQHFLEPAWVEKLIRAIAPRPDQTFVEVGPGRGALTRGLTAHARHVLAFEIDHHLAAQLRASAPSTLTVIHGDFLAVTADRLRAELVHTGHVPATLRVAGNLPYNVASPILFKLLELFAAGLPLSDAIVMLQREVADRLLAAAGTHDYGVLSVLIRHRADVERVLTLPPGAFRPPPRVRSAVVRLRFRAAEPAVRDPRGFAEMVQAIFTRRRKKLANALLAYPAAARLGSGEALALAGIDGRRRPETLEVAELARLSDVLATHSRGSGLPAPGRAVL